jgi:alanine dehydrogenase
MKLRVLSRADVERAVDIDELVDALAVTFERVSAGEVSMPPRALTEVPERGILLAMPVHVHGRSIITTKLVSLFPGNPAGGPPTHQATIVVFDAATGTPLAVMDGEYVTAVRTAAGSRLATRLLARPDAEVLAILGTGVQAESHVRALVRERAWVEIRIAGRRPEAARGLAHRLAAETGASIHSSPTFARALAGADVVCAGTAPTEPVVSRGWLSEGVHINSVGFSVDGREVDADTVRDALVVVEARAAALSESHAGSNDLTWPIRDGVIGADHVHAELGELISGARPGRTAPAQITLYKSVGIAAEDDTAAALVLAAAERQGMGTVVEI